MKNQNPSIKIVEFNKSYAAAFKSINQEWIERFFEMEPMDHLVLNHPEEHIIQPGGHIAIALLHNEPVGACALVKSHYPEFDYELVKMGVKSHAQGYGIGKMLAETMIEKAKRLNAKTIFIESNTVLQTAIALYKKLGFKEISGFTTPYARCNIQLCLTL